MNRSTCKHSDRECLNPFELIRKYRCAACATVLMCACDERLGLRVLPHQISNASVAGSRIPVDGGFVESVCNQCRGLKLDPTPVSETHGRTSKIKRYYWRELYKEASLRFVDWCDKRGLDDVLAAMRDHREVSEDFKADVLEDIKRRHASAPLYEFEEPSSASVLEAAGVEVEDLDGTYLRDGRRGEQVLVNGARTSVEELVRVEYLSRGYQVMVFESQPIHALFGVLMWLWVQDSSDPERQMRAFGGREGVPTDADGLIWTFFPSDFGTAQHAERRRSALDAHLEWLSSMGDGLLGAFEYWVGHSVEFCAYLWAWRSDVIARAGTFLEVVGPDTVIRILRHLAENYWSRYLGWPDLLAWKGGEWLMLEVKSSRDKLSTDQKNWMLDTATALRLPVKVVKVHRRKVVEGPTPAPAVIAKDDEATA